MEEQNNSQQMSPESFHESHTTYTSSNSKMKSPPKLRAPKKKIIGFNDISPKKLDFSIQRRSRSDITEFLKQRNDKMDRLFGPFNKTNKASESMRRPFFMQHKSCEMKGFTHQGLENFSDIIIQLNDCEVDQFQLFPQDIDMKYDIKSEQQNKDTNGYIYQSLKNKC